MGTESQGSRVGKSRELEAASEERNSQELCQKGKRETGRWPEGERGLGRFIRLRLDPSTPAGWREGLGAREGGRDQRPGREWRWALALGGGLCKLRDGAGRACGTHSVKLHSLKQLTTFFFSWTPSSNIPNVHLTPDCI